MVQVTDDHDRCQFCVSMSMMELWERHIAGEWIHVLEDFKKDPNTDGYYFYDPSHECFMFSDMKTAIYFRIKIS
jgi:hypothetical protein